jgi:hypothetical protein
MGASLIVSVPPAMPASIWPSAILLPTMMIAFEARAAGALQVDSGRLAARPEPSTTRGARFQSRECLSTAPRATSPSRRRCGHAGRRCNTVEYAPQPAPKQQESNIV